MASFANDPDSAWLVFAKNFMTPSFWLEIYGHGTGEMTIIKQNVVNKMKLKKAESLRTIDKNIRDTQNLLRGANQGIDISRLA